MWVRFAFFVVTSLINYLLRPNPETPTPATLGDVEIPTVDPGRELPLIGGSVWIEDPQSAWYGDFESIAIKKKGGKK